MLNLFIAAAAAAAAGVAPGLPAPVPPSRSLAIHEPSDARSNANGSAAEVRAKIASCKANMLIDTFAMIEVKGQMRKTHVLLCSKPGETTTQKITTLTNAIAQVKANGQLPATEKARIVTQMQAKLSELAKRN